MELLFRREQTAGQLGRVNFKLWGKIELDPELEPARDTPESTKPKRPATAAPKPPKDDGTAPGEAW